MSARISWDQYAMALARTAALRSEDPWVRVGTVVLREDHSVASAGYNGAPSGLDIDWSDRETRRRFVIHAEANALRYVTPGEAELVATTLMPCDKCLLLMSTYGIKRVVYSGQLDPNTYDVDFILELAKEIGLELIHEEALR